MNALQVEQLAVVLRQDLELASSVSIPCSLHRLHTPGNLTVEFHHLIPVGMQLRTATQLQGTPPSPGQDPNGRGLLWDNRGAYLCPTGHRNVHYWLVAMMHAAVAERTNDPQVAYKAVKPRRAHAELTMALEGITRFVTEMYTVTLVELTTMGEWGQD
jgi:hypothetical protein